jgi:hypothetical protein
MANFSRMEREQFVLRIRTATEIKEKARSLRKQAMANYDEDNAAVIEYANKAEFHADEAIFSFRDGNEIAGERNLRFATGSLVDAQSRVG